jgi:hypothetical protein
MIQLYGLSFHDQTSTLKLSDPDTSVYHAFYTSTKSEADYYTGTFSAPGSTALLNATVTVTGKARYKGLS